MTYVNEYDMNAILNQKFPVLKYAKEIISLVYFLGMLLAAIIILMEAKLHFNLDIPSVDLPFDEAYQSLKQYFPSSTPLG